MRRAGMVAAAAMIFAAMLWAQDAGLTLLDMQGKEHTYSSLKGKVTVVMFFSTRCPLSNAFNYRRNVLYDEYHQRVQFIVIDSNANEPLNEVRGYAKYAGFDFPVYEDIDNKAADQLGVNSTTEALVFDETGAVRYRGYIEDAPNPERTKNPALRLAIEAVLEGKPVPTPETRAIGCAIRRAQQKN